MNVLKQTDLPHITVKKMREVDRIMVERYHIELPQMMELAGYQTSVLAGKMIPGKSLHQSTIGIMAGTGGNGGGALVAARHLANRRADVKVFLSKPIEAFRSTTAHQLNILRMMNVPLALGKYLKDNRNFDLLIDGLIGYSLQGNPHGTTAYMIKCANKQEAPILSIDLPSGLDADRGEPRNPCIKSKATLTLALPKTGFKNKQAIPYTGDLYLADIGVPPDLYQLHAICFKVPNLFETNGIVKITRGL